MTNRSCKREKQSSALPLAARWRRDGGQPDKDQNEQQQQQSTNHSSDNAEIARCLTPFSHPGPYLMNELLCLFRHLDANPLAFL